ncbi:adenosine receptor A3-like [Oculina patagonica]
MPNNTTLLLQASFNAFNIHCDSNKQTIDVYEVSLTSLVAVAILSPVAVVGNALVLAAIWKNPSLRTTSYILLAGLAFTDFCTGIITVPFFAANELIVLIDPLINPSDKNSWPTSYFITRAIGDGFLEYFFHLTSFIITFMSIERWLHMSRQSLVTVRRLYRIIAVLFFLPIPSFFYHIKDQLDNNTAFYFASISVILFCLSVTSAAYFKVFQIIRRHQQQIHANQSSQNFAQPTIDVEKYKKSVFSILYILVIFYIGYSPMAISLGLLFAIENLKLIAVSFYVSIVLAVLASSLNPLLYLWRMRDIRNEVRKLVNRLLCKDS